MSAVSQGTLASRKILLGSDSSSKQSNSYNSYIGFLIGWLIIIGEYNTRETSVVSTITTTVTPTSLNVVYTEALNFRLVTLVTVFAINTELNAS